MRLTRRDAIKQGGALAALLALGGVGGAVSPAAAADGVALSARRRQVYRSLLAALQDTAGGEFRHRDAGEASARFAAWYAAQDAAIRAHADAVLDHLDALGLRAAGRGRALRDLRGWAGEKASPDRAEAVRSAAVAAAVALAAQATAPPPDDDDAPVVPLLVGG